jgi:hypothetical protein
LGKSCPTLFIADVDGLWSLITYIGLMKKECHILILLFSFVIIGCFPAEEEVVKPLSVLSPRPRWVFIKGEIEEENTKLPIANMKVRLVKESDSHGFGWLSYDSVSEVVSDAQGHYAMRFWFDNENEYQIRCLSDSSLLPNPDYFPEKDFWGTVSKGNIYQTQTIFPLKAPNADSVYMNMRIPSYSYVTLKLKRKEGFEEPLNIDIVINNDSVSSVLKVVALNSSSFKKNIAFQSVSPVKIDLRIHRILQSNKVLSQTIFPEPMRVKVVEYEY